MEKIAVLLSDPVFWFSTAVVGLLIGVLGNFATDGIRQFWGRYSDRQRAKNDAEEERFWAEVDKCVRNQSYLIAVTAELTSYQTRTVARLMGIVITWIVVPLLTAHSSSSTSITNTSFTVELLISIPFAIQASKFGNSAEKCRLIIEAAKDRLGDLPVANEPPIDQ